MPTHAKNECCLRNYFQLSIQKRSYSSLVSKESSHDINTVECVIHNYDVLQKDKNSTWKYYHSSAKKTSNHHFISRSKYKLGSGQQTHILACNQVTNR
jgi:UDP-galactopyranose mutase